MAAKTGLFAEKISWLLSCSEISRKFTLLGKSATILNDDKQSIFFIFYALGNDIYTGKTPQETFIF